MSVLAAVKSVLAALWWGLLPAVVAGILAIWHYATAMQGIVIGLVIAGTLAASVLVYLCWPVRDHVHDDPDAAEKYMEPLRQPGQAERTLADDLHRRGMLLRPHGLDPRRAAVLARKVVSRTARARIARTPRPAGRHAAPGKPLGISGSSRAAAREPGHGDRPAAPVPLRMVAGGGLEVVPADPLPGLPASEAATDPGLHEPTMPLELELPGEEDPTVFKGWETGSFAAACGVELPNRRESDAA